MPRSEAGHRYTLIHIDDGGEERESLEAAVRRGLGGASKNLPCRFFYDEEGSLLFEEICALPDYYLTRTEHAILEERCDEIATLFPGAITLAELGSGSATKTRLLIEALLRRHGFLRYVPIDISRSMLETSARELLEDYSALEIQAIASEYRAGLRHVKAETSRPKLIAWLGSNIGNFERHEAASFLAGVRAAMAESDRLLVGIDLRKDRRVLERAYDDEQGVTARFNLNLLKRLNRELGADFDPDHFAHRAIWDERRGRVEICLVSLREQVVSIEKLDLQVHFAEGEAIHTENSYKYSLAEIAELAREADLRIAEQWLDADRRFSVNIFAPAQT